MLSPFAQHSRALGRERERHPRIKWEEQPGDIFAIGDVHGCLDLMRAMEERIIETCRPTQTTTWIIYLGDLVDRGPDSKGVVEHAMSPLPHGYERLSLCGNHDQTFMDFLQAPSLDAYWLSFGGKQTLLSYGIDVESPGILDAGDDELKAQLAAKIPQEHIRFLQSLPTALSMPDLHLVHAGMRHGVPIEQQDEFDLMWIREDFLTDEPASDRLIIHGHTPDATPRIGPGRIGVDTRAVGGGPLTAIHIQGKEHTFLQVSAS